MTFALLVIAPLLAAAPPSAGTFTAPTHVRVDLDYTIHRANGVEEPNTMSKTWFFDVPKKRADDKSMTELLNRIFYDANVHLRQREPDDHAWLKLVKFKTTPVDTAPVLDKDKRSTDAFPWLTSARKVVWEPGACFIVADDGRYDTMEGDDFTELLVNRMLDAKQLTDAQFTAFFDDYFRREGVGQALLTDRVARMKNTASIRTLPDFRKKPGTRPIASGPVDAEFSKKKGK